MPDSSSTAPAAQEHVQPIAWSYLKDNLVPRLRKKALQFLLCGRAGCGKKSALKLAFGKELYIADLGMDVAAKCPQQLESLERFIRRRTAKIDVSATQRGFQGSNDFLFLS